MNNIGIQDKAVGAILGAACGDALGWPNERRGYSGHSNQQYDISEFFQWKKRSGGRYYSHEELIGAGEYSDDTQLILSLCRSLVSELNWCDYWTQVELPFWSTYERGGGGATKRAADAWISGSPPWNTTKYIKRYFDAGGNGVVMRIVPHVLFNAKASEYNIIAENIFLDGITTHGHPRALVGALAFGYSLWSSLKRESLLEYGEVVGDLINNINDWAYIPELPKKYHDWYNTANKVHKDYKTEWDRVSQEMKSLLLSCNKELNKGTLAIDEEALDTLNCFNRNVSGAGTVSAAGALYIASRYAPDPFHGIVKAANARGADTDTIASMAGSLLGIIHGASWLSPLKNNVQDNKYLIQIAKDIVSNKSKTQNLFNLSQLNSSALKKWNSQLFSLNDNSKVETPDGRNGVVTILPDQVGKSGRYKVQFRNIELIDGQSIFIKKISKGQYSSADQKEKSSKNYLTLVSIVHSGIKIPVSSIAKSLHFYKNILGFSIKKQSQETIVFDQGVILVTETYKRNINAKFKPCSLLFIEVEDIEKMHSLVKNEGFRIVTPIGPWGKTIPTRYYFRCCDPDGNIIEVFSPQ